MLALPPDRIVRTCAWLLTAGLLWAPQSLTSAEADEPIDIEAEGIKIDYSNRILRLPKVTIRQGKSLIRADEAIARGVEPRLGDSEWEFRGAVHIEFENGELNADSAKVRFVDDRLHTAIVTGAPANFSHRLQDQPEPHQGRAKTITFDAPLARLRLAGEAWYSDGRNEITTATLVYSLSDRSVENERSASEDSRVRIRIRPKPKS